MNRYRWNESQVNVAKRDVLHDRNANGVQRDARKSVLLADPNSMPGAYRGTGQDSLSPFPNMTEANVSHEESIQEYFNALRDPIPSPWESSSIF
jgi:hypothetical protein